MLVFLAVFSVLASAFAIAAVPVSPDASIDRVRINGNDVAENRINLIPISNSFN